MIMNFADRLLAAIEAKGSPVCVGLDPVYEKLPAELRTAGDDAGRLAAIEKHCRGVLEEVAPFVPAIKPQSAYFETYGAAGVDLYFRMIGLARQLGMLVIGDVKRNDIGSTATAYAAGHLSAANSPDAITVNGYLGSDGILPFVEAAKAAGKGVFVLVRTSNPSARETQDFKDIEGVTLYERMAQLVARIGDGAGLVGSGGYSCVGAVVGATYPDEARRLRTVMPRQIVLVPGYGAQGGTAADCKASFGPDGRGAIVNASRSVIFAHADKAYAGMDWRKAVATAAKAFADDIRQAVGTKKS